MSNDNPFKWPVSAEIEELNSALYWLPKVLDVAPVPRTKIVKYDHMKAVLWLEGVDGGDAPLEALRDVADAMGYPLFLRTDLSSAKHEGPLAYKVASPGDIEHAFARTVEDNEMKFWLSPIAPKAILLREWLDLKFAFTAFGGHRIAREFRVFVKYGEVACKHFYWPADAIEGNFHERETEDMWMADGPEPPRWREGLKSLSVLSAGESSYLGTMSVLAAMRCDAHPFWSVDWAQDIGGKWWLIDMAVGERSEHVAFDPTPGCRVAVGVKPQKKPEHEAFFEETANAVAGMVD